MVRQNIYQSRSYSNRERIRQKIRAERDRLNKEEEKKVTHFYFTFRNDKIVRTEYRERGNESSSQGITSRHSAAI